MLIILTFGRLGNVIIQIIKCICYSLSFEQPIIIDITQLKHNNNCLYFLPNYIFEKNGTNNFERIDTFWQEENFLQKYFEQARKILINLFNPIYNINFNLNFNIDFETSLIIHFRGGDSFNKNNPNWWKHPPYYFYKNIIKNSNYKKILLVIEDYSNPIIKKLSENYNNIFIANNDVYTDFAILCNSHYFVDSQSTFTTSALILNKKIKKLYTSPQIYNFNLNFDNEGNTEIINYNMQKYIDMHFNTWEEYINHLLLEEDPFINN